MSETASKTSITIKKYANRRLYNTATSAYVTLEDLSCMVKEGSEFNVFDAKTSEDITRSVLTQIIVEEEGKSGQQNLLPISFLRQLIGYYGDSLQWMIPKYLEQSMESLSSNQDKIREYFKGPIGGIFPFSTTLEEMSKQNMAMFGKTMNMFSPFSQNIGEAMLAGIIGEAENVVATETAKQKYTAESCQTSKPQTCPPQTFTPKMDSSKTETDKAKTSQPTTCDTSKKTGMPSCMLKTEHKQPENKKSGKGNKSHKANKSQKTASITSLKPENQNPKPDMQSSNTPMPSVSQKTASANAGGSDDMQQKIANLQRQLADLAKSRA